MRRPDIITYSIMTGAIEEDPVWVVEGPRSIRIFRYWEDAYQGASYLARKIGLTQVPPSRKDKERGVKAIFKGEKHSPRLARERVAITEKHVSLIWKEPTQHVQSN